MDFLVQTGRLVLGLLAEIGRLALFTRDALVQGLMPPLFLRQTGDQLLRIGYFSLPVVGLTAFFTGGVLALQIYIGGSRFNAESLVSSIVALGITRELGPVLAASWWPAGSPPRSPPSSERCGSPSRSMRW
jgi:phospholipid/cholesterol/gamma-HCH transport system permease protein